MNSRSPIAPSVCAETTCSHLLRFMSLYDRGRGVSVPCDETGKVDLNALTEPLRATYLGARARVGGEYACPTVQIVH